MAKTGREREHEAREAKLELLREQVSSGRLVIREMTDLERANWAERRSTLDARSTPAERARRTAAIENRRRRSERLSSPPK
jgi:hypothetical protein